MTNINPNDIPPADPAEEDTGFTLKAKTYNQLKTIVTIVLPALVTLYIGLAALWEWANTDKIVGTVTLITALLGVLLKIVKKNYDKSDAQYYGQVNVVPSPEGDLLTFKMNPAAIADQDKIVLKVNKVG